MAVALPALVLTLLSVVVGGASLVVRFRRAQGMERQQLRWVTSAAVVAAAGIPVVVAGISIESPAVVGVAVLGSAAILCLAIAAAILRYRLYDLDRIISRTLAYGLLTVLLGLGYAAVALGLGGLLGRDSSLSVAAFGTRLRDQVDLDTLTADLLTVVDHTMQPTTASLWLR